MPTETVQGKSEQTFFHTLADRREATRCYIELKELNCESRNRLFIKDLRPIPVLGSIATQAPKTVGAVPVFNDIQAFLNFLSQLWFDFKICGRKGPTALALACKRMDARQRRSGHGCRPACRHAHRCHQSARNGACRHPVRECQSCGILVPADPSQAHLPPRTTLVENPPLLARLEPDEAQLVESLVVVQNPKVVEAARKVLAEVQRADHSHQARLEAAGPSSFEVAPPVPFGGPTLIITARQDQIVGYRAAWDLLENYPRATFAVLDRAGHFINVEQDRLCHALMREWLDRVEESSRV